MKKFPSSEDILEEAKKIESKSDVNRLHHLTYDLMKKYRENYYKDKVKDFLLRPTLKGLDENIKKHLESELLNPIKVGEKIYTNFMEETARRISQTFQTISGNIAELCVENELINLGLIKEKNYRKKKEHTDFIFYFPIFPNYKKKHRVEVKNVKLRERATRGLQFDGDSILGFFDDPSEFTNSNIEIIHRQCKKTNGYCYIPSEIIKKLEEKIKNKRFKSNREFATDMKKFIKRGFI